MPEVDRTRRVAELIRRELSTLLARAVNDRRVKMVSITHIHISRDLKHAKVYVSALEKVAAADADAASANTAAAPDAEAAVAALNRAGKYLRGLLSRRLNLRTTPSLRFQYDHSIRRAMDLGELIDALNASPGAEKEHTAAGCDGN